MQELRAEIVGVHPVAASEPCHLIEVVLRGGDWNWSEVTQQSPDLPAEDWQVAYDEIELEQDAEKRRYAFFFHYLDLSQPLLTPAGEMKLPAETPVPPHLREIEYVEP